MKFVRSSLALAVTAGLSACGGGGGSSTLGALVRPTVPFHAPVRINSFQPHVQPHQYRTPLTEIHTRDLNGDGADEVLWSNVAFDWSGTNWINSQVQIFGSNTGSFQNETASWFRSGDNVYTGGFKINFGNFNGQGYTDVFLATFTDTPNHTGPSILLENTVSTRGGVSRFNRRVIDFGMHLHSHDSVVADFNGDGIDDVLMTDNTLMLGSSSGNYTTVFGPRCCVPGSVVGSGLSAADYMADGTVTVVVTDGPGGPGSASDTWLYRPHVVNNELVMEQISSLPTDRFWLPKWQSLRESGVIHGHGVRNMAMDFDRDGRPDVIVFSTAEKDGDVHGWTEVQFLRNDGQGVFTDVTDTVLKNFDHGKTVTYNPQLIDVNNDGLLDIFMSTTDYTGQSSTSVLLATREGTFVESYIQIFDAFNQQLRSLVGSNAGTNQPIAIVTGINNTRYLVSGVEYEQNGVAHIAVYASLIGTLGTLNAQATLELIQQAWPWMSPADANEVLSRTSNFSLNGIAVIDWERIWRPVGELTLDMHGQRQILHGHISIPGFSTALLQSVLVKDDLRRDFLIDLSPLASAKTRSLAQRLIDHDNVTLNWTHGLIEPVTEQGQGLYLTGNEASRFASTVSVGKSDSPWQVSVARMPGSPWISLSGMFGEIRQSTMIDATKIWKPTPQTQLQIGVTQTHSDLRAGIVDRISPLWSLHAMAAWRDSEWSVYGGLRPMLVYGHAELDLPDRVDHTGRSLYTRHVVPVRNDAVFFSGVQRQWRYKNNLVSAGAVTDSQGSYRFQTNIHKEF